MDAIRGFILGGLDLYMITVKSLHRIGIVNGPHMLLGIDEDRLHAMLDAGPDALRAAARMFRAAHGIRDPAFSGSGAGCKHSHAGESQECRQQGKSTFHVNLQDRGSRNPIQ